MGVKVLDTEEKVTLPGDPRRTSWTRRHLSWVLKDKEEFLRYEFGARREKQFWNRDSLTCGKATGQRKGD